MNNENTDTSSGEGQDSPVIRDLRNQLRERNKAIKDLEAQVGDAKTQARREIALETELEHFGMPQSVLDMVAGELADSEITRSSVEEALSGLGFSVNAPAETSEEAPAPAQEAQYNANAESLANVANLAGQVAQAATGSGAASITDRINSAQTPEELSAIMNEAGMGS